MKTLSFEILSSLLFRRDSKSDRKEAKRLQISPIDLVVCNFYPFEQAMSSLSNSEEELVEKIDIGGPTMVRAAAKNYRGVCVLTDPDQYPAFLADYEKNKALSAWAYEMDLALKAYQTMAHYDSIIATRLGHEFHSPLPMLPALMKGPHELRYGENPQQKAWFFSDPFHSRFSSADPEEWSLGGKPLSYNNLLDADTAWRVVRDIANLTTHNKSSSNKKNAVAIVKHTTPCGQARASTALTALKLAWAGDPISAFWGHRRLFWPRGRKLCRWLAQKFIEVVVAPSYTPEAQTIFKAKKNLRLIQWPLLDFSDSGPGPLQVRSMRGGWLLQTEDGHLQAPESLQSVSRHPFPEDKRDLAYFGLIAAKHLKSNAIALVAEATETEEGDFFLIGAGTGQPNRLAALTQALEKAQKNQYETWKEAILASDAFFPFPDSIEQAAQRGIRLIVQPGGSLKDSQIIAACDAHGIAMAMTGTRHFRH